MNRKDIALTVGGIIASFALTYLIYRLQQRDAAANAAAAAAAATDAAAQETQENDYLGSYESGGGNGTGLVDTYSADTAASTTSTTPTQSNDLISQVLSAFTAQQGSNTDTTTPASLLIPTVQVGVDPVTDPSTVDTSVPTPPSPSNSTVAPVGGSGGNTVQSFDPSGSTSTGSDAPVTGTKATPILSSGGPVSVKRYDYMPVSAQTEETFH